MACQARRHMQGSSRNGSFQYDPIASVVNLGTYQYQQLNSYILRSSCGYLLANYRASSDPKQSIDSHIRRTRSADASSRSNTFARSSSSTCSITSRSSSDRTTPRCADCHHVEDIHSQGRRRAQGRQERRLDYCRQRCLRCHKYACRAPCSVPHAAIPPRSVLPRFSAIHMYTHAYIMGMYGPEADQVYLL